MPRTAFRLATILFIGITSSISFHSVRAAGNPFFVPPAANLRHVAGKSDFLAMQGALILKSASDVDKFMTSTQYYVVDGIQQHGDWNYPIAVQITGASPIELVEVGLNNAQHAQLVAVGLANPRMPELQTSTSRVVGRTLSSRSLAHNRGNSRLYSLERAHKRMFFTNACYPYYHQAQATLNWREVVPNLGGTESMSMLVTSESWYTNGTNLNCQAGADAPSDDGYNFRPYNHAFIYYIDSGPTAVAASDVDWKGTDLTGKCVEVHVNGQTVYGYPNRYPLATVNTHAYYCGTSTMPGDWGWNQTLSSS